MSPLPAFVSSFTGKTDLRSHHVALDSRIPSRVPKCRKHVPKMLFNITLPWEKTVALPQYDQENASDRANAIESARTNYIWDQTAIEGAFIMEAPAIGARAHNIWDQTAIEGASMMKGLPSGEAPVYGWYEQLVPVLIRVVINAALNNADQTVDNLTQTVSNTLTGIFGNYIPKMLTGSLDVTDLTSIADSLSPLLNSNVEGNGTTLQDYVELFQNLEVDKVAKEDQFLRDDIFGWYRVAGPNPMKLTLLDTPIKDMFPDLTDEILHGIPGFSGDSLAALENENRLFYVTYPEFDGVPTGSLPDGTKKTSFLYAPTCVLGVPKSPSTRDTVLPLAIYTGQDRSKHPMYTANSTHTDANTWLAAKVTIQVADGVIHETVFHLARTHLLLGIAICSTHRALAPEHPLFRLLDCHSYGTAFINWLATQKLINPGGTIDEITAPDIFVTRGVSASGINGTESKFNDWFPDVDLDNRGVMGSNLKYPYRDDALKHWAALLDFVRTYVTAYYKSDNDVKEDYELAAWCTEMTAADGGNLHGFGDNGDGKILTVEYLIRTITMLIFTGTVQHAAVNYTQGTLMQHSPALPLGGYAPAPTTEKPYDSLDQFVEEMFPPLNLAEKQLTTAELIGVLKYGIYGDYGSELSFAPTEVADALGKLADDLGAITGQISERVKTERESGLPEYDQLLPSKIPKSINI